MLSQVKLELRSISEEERVKSGLTRAKLGGLSKAEIMEMVKIIIFVETNLAVLCLLYLPIKGGDSNPQSKAEGGSERR